MLINPLSDALLIIDPQNDFCPAGNGLTPGGALAVPGGDEIMGPINTFALMFSTIVVTQDWHPKRHKSFASTHGREPFSTIAMPYGEQTLWPDHCVRGTFGAMIHRKLSEAHDDFKIQNGYTLGSTMDRAALILRKGMNPEIDSYSSFRENDRKTSTGLAGFLRDRGITRVFLCGLAFDFCVGFSALDAREEGFAAVVVRDLTRAIAMPAEGSDDNFTTADQMSYRLAQAGLAEVVSEWFEQEGTK